MNLELYPLSKQENPTGFERPIKKKELRKCYKARDQLEEGLKVD